MDGGGIVFELYTPSLSCLSFGSCQRGCSVDVNVGMEVRGCLPIAVLLASSHNQAQLHDQPTRRDMNPSIYLLSGPHIITFRFSVGNVWC